MNYCIRFNKDSKYLDTIEELVIDFTPGRSEMLLQSFIDMHANQRVTMDIGTIEPSKELIAAVANLRDSSKFAMRFDKKNAAALKAIPKLGIKWYLTNAALTYDDIFTYKNLGASEFFIGAQLGFDLPHCKAIADSLDMKIRSVYAYAVEATPIYRNYWQYFIRPEDVTLYSQYIDTIELYGEPHMVNILVKAYRAEKWNGPLNEIIPIVDQTYDSRFIIPHWGRRRINCNRKCMYGDSCTMCETIYNLSQTLEEAKIIIPSDIRAADTSENKPKEEKELEVKPNF